jgi:hypothetical protein
VGCNTHVHGSKARISLHSYLYLKLANAMSFLLSLMFSLQQNWRQEDGTGTALEGWEGGGPNNIYTSEKM